MITPYSNIISVTTLGPLLDTYTGAAAAYSLRKLRSAYTGSAIRVRRASDNTEQDIGFVSNELDTSTLTSFCSGTNGFVKTWYDQSGNGYDATQSTAASQPQIVSSGSVILENGKPTMTFDGVNDYLETASFSLVTSNISLINVFKFNVIQSFKTFISYGTFNVNGFLIQRPSSDVYRYAVPGGFKDYGTSVSTNQSLLQLYDMSSGFTSVYRDSNLLSTQVQSISTNTTDVLAIGRRAGYLDQYAPINGQEFIFYASDQSSNRTGIETNINDFYSIY